MIQGPPDREKLAHQISVLGQDLLKMRQVYSRLHRLLPARYADVVRKLRRTHDSGKARRLALMDSEYLGYLEELNDLSNAVLRTKVEWDVKLLLYRSSRRS